MVPPLDFLEEKIANATPKVGPTIDICHNKSSIASTAGLLRPAPVTQVWQPCG